jgi:hypothetical protein
MAALYAHVIPQVEPPRVGIHLLWLGPLSFGYAPGGWTIERRLSQGRRVRPRICDELAGQRLELLRRNLELQTTVGTVRLTAGKWPDDRTPGEVFTWELDRPEAVNGSTDAKRAFVYGIRDGKAVSFAGPAPGAFDLGPHPVDRVVALTRDTRRVRLCLRQTPDWERADMVKRLQLPLRELMPSLGSDAAEFAEAKSRLQPGETIDEDRFHELADSLRSTLKGLGSRPVDRLLVVRRQEDTEFEELPATDPIRILYTSPTWRRVLGLSLFDTDPALVPGSQYDYRITGLFPAGELADRIYGFHTVPAGSRLPAEFRLGDCVVTLPEPTVVGRAPSVAETGSLVSSRRGIPLVPRGDLPWIDFGFGEFSAVIDLPSATTSVVLELDSGHSLRFQSGLPWGGMTPLTPVPPGERVTLTFSAPATQLRLVGTGFLFAIRLPQPTLSPSPGLMPLSTVLLGVKLENTPRPVAPLAATAENLQQPLTDDPAPPHALGFEVRWLPAPAVGLPFWPDPAVPPPLDATGFQIERRREPAGAFEPLLPGENVVMGNRDGAAPTARIHPGADLMEVCPEVPEPQEPGEELSYRDVFNKHDADDPTARAIPDPGTFHRYRVRTLDAVGRPSLDWRVADPVRLEKHEPPPIPAAPEEIPADAMDVPAPTGVRARVLVRGDPELSADDLALLSTSENAVVLEWGWHGAERALDPFARQFRFYASAPLDEVEGAVTAVTPVTGDPGAYMVQLDLARPVPADAARGLPLDAGYPFFVTGHSAGSTIAATVRTVVPGPGGAFRVPALGPVKVPLRWSGSLTRPAGWGERVGTVAITAAEQYSAVLRDRLVLTPDHPRDTLWVGVSAADDQPYVADTFPGASPPLPGNESAVVAVLCRARRLVRPELVVPPPLGPMPRILAPEPVDGPFRFQLDLLPFLGPEPAPGELVLPERLLADDLAAALRLDGNRILARAVEPHSPAEPDLEVSFANPGDQAAVVAALESGDVDAVDDRFLVHLAAIHPYRDRLFRAATTAPLALAAFEQILPQRAGSYLYRFRRADARGQLSPGGAMAEVVVRVPALTPSAPPAREPRHPGDPPTMLRLRIPPDPRVRQVLVFERPAPAEDPREEAELLRVPNRPDLAPADALRLRVPGGTLLTATVVDVDTLPPDDGGPPLVHTPAGAPAERVQVWAATLTGDGIPSMPGGPWRVTFPPPPLPEPALSVAAGPTSLDFSWTWPGPDASVQLERSADSGWVRISPVLSPPRVDFSTKPDGAGARYRLRVVSAAGRAAFSNEVTP